MSTVRTWVKDAWKTCHNAQPIDYPCDLATAKVLTALADCAPLVTAERVQAFSDHLRQVQAGEALILQGGECAEALGRSDEAVLTQARLLADLADCLSTLTQKLVVPVGRFAGQFAKPRSALTQRHEQQALPVYRGEMINGRDFNAETRAHDPQRLVQAYNSAQQSLVALQQQFPQLFVSHEALHLGYEEALTRQTSTGEAYLSSTHFPWIGMRTAQPQGAHVTFASGLMNPVAVKVGADMTADNLQALVMSLNPDHMPGHLTLITRLGCNNVMRCLPRFIEAVAETGVPVVWLCDPMHGNTQVVSNGLKTRCVDQIVQEINLTAQVHQRLQTRLSGLHCELTAEPVVECFYSAADISVDAMHYTSLLDPRLNSTQAELVVRAFAQAL